MQGTMGQVSHQVVICMEIIIFFMPKYNMSAEGKELQYLGISLATGNGP
jgi:hypothetical protein